MADDPTAHSQGGDILLQALAVPDPVICDDVRLYARLDGGAAFEHGAVSFPLGGTADFGTYMNLFNLGTWMGAGRLHGLRLRLSGRGRLSVRIKRYSDAQTYDLLTDTQVDLDVGEARLDIGSLLEAGSAEAELPPQQGLLALEVAALSPAELATVGWTTRDRDATPVRLAICVTSYRRERETAQTVDRITRFLDDEGAALGAEIGVIVVDNGRTLDLPSHPRLKVIQNRNLGGAGGFARGLAEAREDGYSHALFMDDDARFAMENLRRAIAFLRVARSPRAALAGAMISDRDPTRMWENGAVFHTICRPQFSGTDLADPRAVRLMELAGAHAKPPNYYGGWWFFAFPIASAKHDPFPFFVRGDDISFSLANRFDITTLNGVVSVQEDFGLKQSPLTFYLDLRNHLHHHLVFDDLELGALGTALVTFRFVLRNLVRMHYGSARATLLAWEDVMRGPEFFARNADLSERRREIAALAEHEAWQDVPPMPAGAVIPKKPAMVRIRAMQVMINGLLLPFFDRFAREVHVPANLRGEYWVTHGARRAVFYDATGTRGYIVRHSKRDGWAILWRTARLAFSWVRHYRSIRDAHREAYGHLTSAAFWQEQFEADGPRDPAA